MPNNILDLDKIIPDKRIIKLAGKEIDVSVIPTRVSLEIIKNAEKFKDLTNNADDTLFDMVLDLTVKVIKPSFPEVSRDWLLDNTKDLFQLQKLLEFVLEPLQQQFGDQGNQSDTTKKKADTLQN